MKKYAWIGLFSAFLSSWTLAEKVHAEKNTVLIGGVITTMNEAQPTAEALAFDNKGTIIAVGDINNVKKQAGSNAHLIDLQGTHILPGFQDVHLHAVEAGVNENKCVLTQYGTLSQYRQEIADCAEEQIDDDWFVTAGVSMPSLLQQTERPIDLLDELIPNKPALILDNIGHGAWVNSLALKAVGYDQLKEPPKGGLLDRDGEGTLSGVVYENAQQALRTAASPPTKANKKNNYEGLKRSLKMLAANGITSVSDAGGYWPRGEQEAWVQIAKEGGMSVRASNAFYVFPDRDMDKQIETIIALKKKTKGPFVRFDQVKIYVDGILTQGTAALKTPYINQPIIQNVGTKGFEYFSKEDLFDYVRRFDEAGFSVHFHAVGDRGVALALDAIEAAQKANGITQNRHRMTHLYLVDPLDIPRFAELGVVADIQMAPSSIDSAAHKIYQEILGRERANQIIPTLSLLNSGAEVTLSSDWDADELNPLVKISVALQRKSQNIPDVMTALKMLTITPAKLLRHDDITGSIEVGKKADLVVLDQNLLKLSPEEISQSEILATVMNGRTVYDPEGIFRQ